MKRTMPILIACLLFMAWSAVAFGDQVTIKWDPNPPAEQVAKYVVHYGPTSRADPAFSVYPGQQETGTQTEATIDVPVGTYIAVTAETAAGVSSAYSAEIQTTALGGEYTIPSAPGGSSGDCAITDGLGRTITATCTITVEH